MLSDRRDPAHLPVWRFCGEEGWGQASEMGFRLCHKQSGTFSKSFAASISFSLSTHLTAGASQLHQLACGTVLTESVSIPSAANSWGWRTELTALPLRHLDWEQL